MNAWNVVSLGLVAFVIGVSLLNPGGWIVALFLAGIIILVRFGAPWIGDYVLSINKGRRGRKSPSTRSQQSSSNDSGGGRE